MSNILFVTSSIFGENSKSRTVALDLLTNLKLSEGAASVTTRDVAGLPHFDGDTLGALMTPAEKRDAAQTSRVALADTLIGEAEAADTIVIAAPMYIFSISSQLKAWIDHIARSGRTFRYSAAGPEGLLKGKKVYIVAARGGLYANGGPAAAMDFQEPYLRGVLGFLGLTDVSFVYVEGLNMGPEAVANGFAVANKRIAQLVPTAIAA